MESIWAETTNRKQMKKIFRNMVGMCVATRPPTKAPTGMVITPASTPVAR